MAYMKPQWSHLENVFSNLGYIFQLLLTKEATLKLIAVSSHCLFKELFVLKQSFLPSQESVTVLS
jgi:hypothetical protein